MRLLCGTSGYAYDEWRGGFYPADLRKDGMLAFYAEQLPTVEINNTFYRMPRSAVVEKWGEATPPGFRFVLKATRRITHFSRLADCADTVAHLFRVADVLGDKLGPVLFQLPPTMRRDTPRLESFLGTLPEGRRVALEFRHDSWLDDDVYETLRRFGAALVGGDADGSDNGAPLLHTGPVGYLRLRRTDYADADLDAWYRRIVEQGCEEVFVFFKHETDGPALARRLLERVAAA